MTSNNANPHHYSLSDGDLKRSVDEACANDLSIELPVRFIVELSVAPDIDTIMQVIARWSRVIFRADRVTIALPVDATHLRLVAMEGNDAIPLDMPVPIAGTMVGRVFAQGKAEICPDLTLSEDWDCKMLTSKGLQSCLDVPLLSGSRCFGTINIGHCHRNAQDVADLIRLQAMAHWVASWLRIHHQVDEMRTLADIDPLTGALNRRAFARKFAAMSADWDARGDPKKAQLGIAMIDLDHFKAINDRYGHSAGDRVLHPCQGSLGGQLPRWRFDRKNGRGGILCSDTRYQPAGNADCARPFHKSHRIRLYSRGGPAYQRYGQHRRAAGAE